MKVVKSHKIKLNPTKSQVEYFVKASGVSRFTYNWAIDTWEEMYNKGEKPSAMTLNKHLNSIKKDKFPWMLEVTKTSPQYAIWDLEDSFKKYFKGLKDGSIQKKKDAYISKRKSKGLPINKPKLINFGKPKFKKKGLQDSFVAVENYQQFRFKDKKIGIPRLGYVKCHEDLRFEGKVNNVVVKRVANMWFAIVNVEMNLPEPLVNENQVTVGLDFGIKTLITLSDEKTFENPKALRKNLKCLKRLQRSLSRKQKGSSNRKKQQMKVARKHYRVSCIRSNALHQATSYITNNYDKIVIEDLNVSGMIKNRKLSQAISDVDFYELRRQLDYKSKWKGKEVVVADRFFPSSKTCSCCGYVKPVLKLDVRTYKCESCGHEMDRDLNAAINLANYSPTEKIPECEACGELNPSSVKKSRSSKKQEIILINKLKT